jgi:glycosyltransferase involved in cell wall biosynthesis
MSAINEHPRDVRGRVVMLVDNGVRGDSRVQKAAASAADAGWEVILLGRSTDDKSETWSIGAAEVRLIPVPSPLTKRPYEFRRSWLRPLAYPPTGIGPYRAQRVRAWRADIVARRAGMIVAAERGGPPRRLARLGLSALSLSARVTARWVSLRRHQLTSAQNRRRRLDGPWDRLTMAFWRLAMRERAWRRLEPRLFDFELAFGEVIDQLRPDLIHANDFYMLGVGARAALRARAAGHDVKLVWDAHELVSGLKSRAPNIRWLPAHIAHEREYARYADATITVSDELAQTLQTEHRLRERPTVVLNAPEVHAAGPAAAPDIRKLCEVDAHTPLLVYSGAAAQQRGLDIMVEALPQVPDVHVALVVTLPPSRYVQSLLDKATGLGVADRLHLVPYVPYDQVVAFLSGADAGVIPIHHWPNHEIALITKFFEYAHARLPMIVSDVRTMGMTTRELGQGEVFRAEDIEDYVRTVKLVLSDLPRYRQAYDRPGLLETWTWEAQSKVLDDVYTRLVPDAHRPARLVASETPHISVVMPVYNAMPYLTKAIRSLLDQSIGLDCFEVVAVDDGSTDGSGARLDAFARKYPNTFKVAHRPSNSGGPAVPANLALTLARGRYVFFLGADDYLGPEALERMVVAADRYRSDVLAAKMVGVNGRYVSTDLFTGNHANVSLYDSPLPYALSNTKLFRRDLIEEHSLRFPEDLTIGSDQPFTLEACVRAGRISVLSDYDYYFAVRREDGDNVTSKTSHLERLRCTERIMATVTELVPSAEDRGELARRHFTFELSRLVREELLTLDRTAQEQVCAGVGDLVRTHMTDAVADQLDTSRRVRFRLAELGRLDDLIGVIRQDLGPRHAPFIDEGDDLYLAYDCFRVPGGDLPDRLFRVSSELAESIASRVQVTSTAWGRTKSRARALVVQAYSPVDLAALGADEVGAAIGDAVAEVTVAQDKSGGTRIRAALRLTDLLSDTMELGERRAALLRLSLRGSRAEVPLGVPSTVDVIKRSVRRGSGALRLSVRRSRDGTLVIDYVPVTMHRVLARLRRIARRIG